MGNDEDFAKILRTAEGHQVLVYIALDDDGDREIRCVVSIDGVVGETALRGIPSAKIRAAFDAIGDESAEKIYAQTSSLIV